MTIHQNLEEEDQDRHLIEAIDLVLLEVVVMILVD
jgi:hypothetical protein